VQQNISPSETKQQNDIRVTIVNRTSMKDKKEAKIGLRGSRESSWKDNWKKEPG